MATAHARRMQARDPRPVVVRDRDGAPRWHAIWDQNPRIVRPSLMAHYRRGGVQNLYNFPGGRPYLAYDKFNNRDKSQPYVYTNYRVDRGEIYLTSTEKELGRQARGRVILEPNIKPAASRNKDWGWQRWQTLADRLRDLRPLQIGAPGSRRLEGVEFLPTLDVRQAAGVLSGAALLIAPEGGLHHAAAALKVRAVVIFGGFISPATTGYDMHVNLFRGEKPCGMRRPCAHCAQAMAQILPLEVELAARGLLELAAA